MAPYSSTLAWKIPWTEELGRLQSMGSWELDTTQWLHFHFSLHALEKDMATHSSVLAWRIPGTAEPDGLPSMGSHRVGHDWSELAAAVAASGKLKRQNYPLWRKFKWMKTSQGTEVYTIEHEATSRSRTPNPNIWIWQLLNVSASLEQLWRDTPRPR